MNTSEQIRQIAAVNAGLYRSAESDREVLGNQIAQVIESECDHDPHLEKYDVCIACASAANIAREHAASPSSTIPVIRGGEEHIAGLRVRTAAAIDLADWLRDERLIRCKHNLSRRDDEHPLVCSPCLRDRLMDSPWIQEHDAALIVAERIRMKAWLDGHAEELVREAADRIAQATP